MPVRLSGSGPPRKAPLKRDQGRLRVTVMFSQKQLDAIDDGADVWLNLTGGTEHLTLRQFIEKATNAFADCLNDGTDGK